MFQRTIHLLFAVTFLSLSLGACGQAEQSSTEKMAETTANTSSTETAEAAVEQQQIEDVSSIAETITTKTEEATMPSTRTAVIKTTMGDMKIELNAEKAPLSVANFIEYAEADHYNGTLFHRVIPGFMIQGGGFATGMQQKPTNTPIDNEANNGLSNETYTLAMARTNAPNSATSQFFVNVVDNDRLDFTSESGAGWGYAVFGKVVEGQEVVKAIEAVETGQVGPYGDVPKEDVLIESVTIVE